MRKPKDTYLGIRVERRVIAILKKIADREHRSLSAVVRMALEDRVRKVSRAAAA